MHACVLTHIQLFVIPQIVPARLLCPLDSPGKNTRVGCHALLQGIFPTQESNHGLLHCRRILQQLSYQGLKHFTLLFSGSVVSDSLRHHESQHARPPCPSSTPGVHPNSCLSSRVGDAIQPSHPPSSPSLLTFNLSQHHGLFKRISSSHQVAEVLEFQPQHQSFQ